MAVARFFLVGGAHFLFFRGRITQNGTASTGGAKLPGRSSSASLARLRNAAERVAGSYGLEIFDVQLRREPVGTVLRVVIDRMPAGGVELPEESVGIEDCQRVSQDLSALLDVEDEFGEQELENKYILEVSSPGLDRPLRHEGDFRRFAGRLTKLVTTEPIERQSAFAGRLRGIEDGDVVLEEGRKVHRVPLGKIKRAHLDVEF